MEVAAGLDVEPRLGAEDKAGETCGGCGAVVNEQGRREGARLLVECRGQ